MEESNGRGIWSKDGALFWMMVSAFAIGVVLILVYINAPIVDNGGTLSKSLVYVFAKELGFALIIASILAFTVERATRRRHEDAAENTMRSINKNIFKAIYGRYIPEEVFSEVERCLLTTDVVRKQYQIDYTLDYIKENDYPRMTKDDKDTHLKVDLYSKYTLENTTNRHTEVPIELHLEKPIDDLLVEYIQIESVIIGAIEFSKEEIEEICKTHNTKEHVIFAHRQEMKGRESIEVSMTAKILKRKVDAEIWASRFPSSDITVRIISPCDISVMGTANHSQKLIERKMNGKQIFELKHGIFPFQSIIFWWKDRPNATCVEEESQEV